MANRNFDQGYDIGKRLVRVAGSFVPLTGAGTVDATKVKGFGFGYMPVNGAMALNTTNRPGITGSTPGITRTGTGLYTIVLDDAYIDIVSVWVHLAGPATGISKVAQAVDPVANLGVSGTAPTLTIVITSSGTPADADAGCRLHFQLLLRDSTVQYGKP